MADLPSEIWYHIISFMPQKAVRRLFAVNRIFFNETMNEKYRKVVVDSKDCRLLQILQAIRNPAIACRVESVHIIPDLSDRACFNGSNDSEERSLPWVQSFDTNQATSTSFDTKAACQHRERVAPSCYNSQLLKAHTPEYVLEAIRGLHCLEAVHIEWNHFKVLPSTYATTLWSVLTSHPSLRAVTLTTTTTGLNTLIPSSPAIPNNLTSFTLTVKHKSNAAQEDADLQAIQSSLVCFLNSLQSSLQVLHARAEPFHDLPFFWAALGYFPFLKTLIMDLCTPPGFSFNPDEPRSLPCHDFLTRHRGHVENLSCRGLRFGHVNPEQKMVAKLSFPKLQSLSINTSILTARRQRLVAFLKRHKHTLKSFEILGEISPAELEETLDALVVTLRYSMLTALSISVYKLDINLLRKLARQLPALQTLKLRISSVANQNSASVVPGLYFPLQLAPHTDAHGFVTDIMECQEIARWNLRHITISRISCCSDLILWNLMRLLSLKIPTICHFADKEYLDIPDHEDLEKTKKVPHCIRVDYCCFHGQDGFDASFSTNHF